MSDEHGARLREDVVAMLPDPLSWSEPRLERLLRHTAAQARYMCALSVRNACWESADCPPCPRLEDEVIAAKAELAAIEAERG